MLKRLKMLPPHVSQQTKTIGKITDFLVDSHEVARLIYFGHDDHQQADIIKRQMKGSSMLICCDFMVGIIVICASENALQIILISNNPDESNNLITRSATTTYRNLID